MSYYSKTIEEKKNGFQNLPESLRAKNNWVVWRKEYRDGQEKPTKVLYDAHEYLRQRSEGQKDGSLKAKSTDSATWASYETAIEAMSYGEFDGIGFCFSDDIVGVDIDGMKPGTINEQAGLHQRGLFPSYAERSPSGDGLHVICRGDISDNIKRHIQKANGVEIYSTGRYFTMTGDKLGEYSDVAECQPAIDRIFKHMPLRQQVNTADSPPENAIAEDATILAAALTNEKFSKGYLGGYAEDAKSETAAAMTVVLSLYSRDREQITRILMHSKLFQNSHWSDKWDRLSEKMLADAFGRTQTSYETYKTGLLQQQADRMPLYEAEELPKASPVVLDDEPDPDAIKPRKKRKAYSLDELEALPSPKWQIKKFFTEGSFVIIYGTSGNYKSFVSLDWAMSIATGTRFLDEYETVKGKVAYIVSEGAAQFKKRVRAWLIDHDMKSCKDICFIPHSFKPGTDGELEELMEISTEALGCRPDLIVIDTLSRNFNGDPNSNKDMQEFCNWGDQIRDFGCTVVIVHHTGHTNQDRERSASNLRDSADTSFQCEKLSDYGCKLTCKKQKDDEDGWAIQLQGKLIDVTEFIKTDDPLTTSLAFEYTGTATEVDAQNKELESAEKFASIAKFLVADVNQGKGIAELEKLTGMKRPTLKKIMTNAFNQNWVLRTGEACTGYRYFLFASAN